MSKTEKTCDWWPPKKYIIKPLKWEEKGIDIWSGQYHIIYTSYRNRKPNLCINDRWVGNFETVEKAKEYATENHLSKFRHYLQEVREDE